MWDEIYSSDTLRVVRTVTDQTKFEAQGCELITFEPLARVAGRVPFGARLAEKYQLNAMHIIPISNDWYQYDDLPACLAAAARHAAPDVTVYGSSMGGFAATTYADSFPGCKVIALSPQFSIRRDLVPFEKRWAEEAARIRFLPGDDRVAQGCHIYLFVDMKNVDGEHARLIAERGNVTLIDVPGGGHPVGPVLVEAGCLSALILAIMQASPSAEELRRIVLDNVSRSPMHHFVLAAQSRLRDREDYIRRGLTLDPNHIRLRHEYALYLAAIGKKREALAHFEHVLQQRPQHPAYRRNYLRVCQAIGIHPRALQNAPEAGAPLEPEGTAP